MITNGGKTPTMNPERRFRTSVNKHLRSIYKWAVHDTYEPGVPDQYYSGSHGDLWAEYKYLPKDVTKFDLTRPFKSPKLSRTQQLWLNNRREEGRRVCVIVGMPSGGVILVDDTWMAPFFVEQLLTRKEIAAEILRICG